MEQGHCTPIAVKRYRDPQWIGGRHNFLLRPYGLTNIKENLPACKFVTIPIYIIVDKGEIDIYINIYIYIYVYIFLYISISK